MFLTSVISGRRALLANDFAHAALRGLWERSAEMNGWFVGDYMVMPDHVHLFARSEVDADKLGLWVKMWKSVCARALIRELTVTAPVWQEEYFDRFLRSDESYEQKWEYVRNNPVRAGLVANADDWPYKGTIFDLQF